MVDSRIGRLSTNGRCSRGNIVSGSFKHANGSCLPIGEKKRVRKWKTTVLLHHNFIREAVAIDPIVWILGLETADLTSMRSVLISKLSKENPPDGDLAGSDTAGQ